MISYRFNVFGQFHLATKRYLTWSFLRVLLGGIILFRHFFWSFDFVSLIVVESSFLKDFSGRGVKACGSFRIRNGVVCGKGTFVSVQKAEMIVCPVWENIHVISLPRGPGGIQNKFQIK